MLEFLAKRRLWFTWVLLAVVLHLGIRPVQAQWYGADSQNGTHRQNYQVWVPDTSALTRFSGAHGQYCALPANRLRLSDEDHLNCVQTRLDEIRAGNYPELPSVFRSALASEAGFRMGFAQGALEELGDALTSIWTILTDFSKVFQAVWDNPKLAVRAVHEALVHGLNTLTAYICEPGFKTAKDLGEMVGRVTIDAFGLKGGKAIAEAIVRANAMARAAGIGELGAVGSFRVFGDLRKGLVETWQDYRRGKDLSPIFYAGEMLEVVPQNLVWRKNNQLLLAPGGKNIDAMSVSETVAQKMALELAGAEALPPPRILPAGGKTGIPGEGHILYVLPAKDGSGNIVLRNFASAIAESGPAWTIQIQSKEFLVQNGFDEIKILRKGAIP
ncbi:hypothetical protein ACSSZE_08105 [Acidithiobacillus caldus]